MIQPVINNQYINYSLNNTAKFNKEAAASVPAAIANTSVDGDKLELSGKKPVEQGQKPEAAQECQTCKNRTYVDSSDDPGVSFKSPTSVSPQASYAAVTAHEQEHVSNEQADAKSEGREVIRQSVSLQYATCPECGKSYVAGGTTTTVTAGKTGSKTPEEENLGVLMGLPGSKGNKG